MPSHAFFEFFFCPRLAGYLLFWNTDWSEVNGALIWVFWHLFTWVHVSSLRSCIVCIRYQTSLNQSLGFGAFFSLRGVYLFDEGKKCWICFMFSLKRVKRLVSELRLLLTCTDFLLSLFLLFQNTTWLVFSRRFCNPCRSKMDWGPLNAIVSSRRARGHGNDGQGAAAVVARIVCSAMALEPNILAWLPGVVDLVGK